jgi:hypothetical protein
MGQYRIFIVSTAKARPGKVDEVAEWWREKGKPLFEATPGTKSVNAYTVQFGLGGEYGIEIWSEVEDYASFDRLDEDILDNPQKYGSWREARELIEWGPTRIMGDWPESQFPLGED